MDAASSDRIAHALVSADFAEAQGDFARLSTSQRAVVDAGLAKLHTGDITGAHALSTVLDRHVRMPVYRWADVQAAVAKLAKKAKRRALPEPSISEVSRETIGEGDDAQVWVTARVLGAAPVMHGWSLLGTVVPGVDNVLVYGDCEAVDMHCDHCGKNRRRSLCFVASHEDGRVVQVGSTCVDEYLGAEALAAWLVTSELHEVVGSMGGGYWDVDAYASWLAAHPAAKQRTPERVHAPIALADFMAALVAEIRVNGYVKGSDAYRSQQTDEPVEATGRKVWTAMQTADHVSPNAADSERAAEILAWINTLPRNRYNDEGDLIFVSSLAGTASGAAGNGATLYDANTLAAAVPSYGREVKRRAEQAALVNEHIGTVGETIDLIVTVTRTYGSWVTGLVEGRTVCWQSRKRDAKVGDVLSIRAKVSEHGEFRGTAQTNLQGVKIK